MPVKVLPQTLINQIAAGEVIVRMASVVKELVENSIDAGATRIEVLVDAGARDLEVRDNGSGMDREDAELALQRHATSKIESLDDLLALQTRGFRGEAVPSIASVSRLEMQTRPHDALSGTRVVVEGGRIVRIEPAGCPPGTRMIVRELFYNVPARRKFIKTPASELNAVMATLMRQAMAQPAIGFRVERGGQTVMELPEGQTLADRFQGILSGQIKRPLLHLDFERDGCRVAGLLAHPHEARGDRRSQFFFVNGRPFASRPLAAALEQACKGYVMAGRFPICCVMVECGAGEVDFNVHPTKDEVRFQNERLVAGTVYHAARHALEGCEDLMGEMQFPKREDAPEPPSPAEPPAAAASPESSTPQPEPAGRPAQGGASGSPFPGFFDSPERLLQRAFDRKQHRTTQPDILAPPAAGRTAEAESPPSAPHPAPAKPPRLPRIRTQEGEPASAGPGERPDPSFWDGAGDPEPLGQVAETYIVARHRGALLVVDQHAAHERLVYLRLKRRPAGTESQPLLLPMTVELTAAQSETLRELAPLFGEQGFDLEPFGPRSWLLKSVPADLPEFDPVPLLTGMIDDYEEARRVDALEELRDRLLIRAACHGSIRAGAVLSREEMAALLRQIKEERLSLTCPHGRPTIVRLSREELDRQFKRVG